METDKEGLLTLHAIQIAKHFNQWMYEAIQKDLTGRILEIGCGIGNISEFFVRDQKDIILSDLRKEYREAVSIRLPGKKILDLDLVHADFQNQFSELKESFDSVFALNVIEHIENDKRALLNAAYLLKPGGTLLILVPAYRLLYNSLDKSLQHFKRYDAKSMDALINDLPLQKQRITYFNLLGVPAWILSGFLGQQTIRNSQMKIYDRMVPLGKFLDKLISKRAGLSLILVAKKKIDE